jgi:hypothetical protein
MGMTEGHRTTGQAHSIPLGMAGYPLQLRTDSTTVTEIAISFFRTTGLHTAQQAGLDRILIIRKCRYRCGEDRDSSIFRGNHSWSSGFPASRAVK